MGTLGRRDAGGRASGAAPRAGSGEPVAAARRRFTVEADSDVRLDLLLARELELSRTQSATLIAQGHVTVDGRQEKASYRPAAGEVITADIPARSAPEITPEQIELAVAYEDEHLLVVDKPAGMVVHPAPGNWSGTLVNALLGRSGSVAAGEGERAGIVHRLDKETSGLLIVARTERAHRLLSAAIAGRRVSRRYAVMIWGHLGQDRLTIEKPVARSPRDRKRMAVVTTGGRPARTDLVRLARFGIGDLLRAHLHTGRTHQIRVHLASAGHPVMGDDTYGGGGGRKVAGLPPRRHFLHAAWLRFHHPATGEELDIRSPLPDDLRSALVNIAGMPELDDAPDPLAHLRFYDAE